MLEITQPAPRSKYTGGIDCVTGGVLTTVASCSGTDTRLDCVPQEHQVNSANELIWSDLFIVTPGDRISSNSEITTAARSAKVQIYNPLTIFTQKQKDYIRDQSQENKEEHVNVNNIEGGDRIELREDELRYFFRVFDEWRNKVAPFRV